MNSWNPFHHDLAKIREAHTEKVQRLSDTSLMALWRQFSDEAYCAGWTAPNTDSIREFYAWLEWVFASSSAELT